MPDSAPLPPALSEAVSPPASPAAPPFRSRDPLHGVTLETILRRLVDFHGWGGLADRIPVRCFMFDPTVTSSLKFLRKTPWARLKLEALFRDLLDR